ncbi:hypothetical protein [Undibacterium pigrum]|uniref:DUF1444 family protein n=1 Tax=Undibacterium pigrum TaxID=401470 RepID=A0A318J4I8_9BURK|nr:hypothetical protein [Undibacterium pigrum]PXX42688.1 hypothetical protein DFR42_105351 [Undibacterium pigrum]
MGFFDLFKSRPSTQKFAQIVIKYARNQGLAQTMHFDEAEFRLVVGENGSHVLNLHNAYRDYCAAAKSQRDNVLLKYTAGLQISGIPEDFASAKEHLMPSLKPRGQGEYLRLNAMLQDQTASYEEAALPFGEDALLMLAYDTEHSMALVNRSNYDTWNISLEEALKVALDNLRDRTTDQFTDLGDGVIAGVWEDAYDSSRILLSDLLYRAGCGSAPVMMVPTRGRLLLCPANSSTAQLNMLNHAKNCMEQEGRVVSAGMYMIRDGKPVSYTPDNADVLDRLHNLQTTQRAEDYSTQKELLDALHDKTGKDIFVASYTVLKNNDTDKLTSLSTWTQDVVSLLPKTDLVAMVIPGIQEGDYNNKILSWEDLHSIAGELMQRVHGYPERYLVTDFPAQDKLDGVAESTL